jgi:hypothetical protein
MLVLEIAEGEQLAEPEDNFEASAWTDAPTHSQL